jgi:hypothetical protein
MDGLRPRLRRRRAASRGDGEDQDQHRAQREARHREAEEADDGEHLVEPAPAPHGGQNAGRQSQRQAETQCGQRERQRVGVARGDQAGNRRVQADGAAQVAVQDAGPVVQVLRQERQIEAVLVAQGRCRLACALAQHLQNGVAGDQVNEQKDQRNHQPDDRKRESETGENLLHGSQGSGIRDRSVVSGQWSGVRGQGSEVGSVIRDQGSGIGDRGSEIRRRAPCRSGFLSSAYTTGNL